MHDASVQNRPNYINLVQNADQIFGTGNNYILHIPTLERKEGGGDILEVSIG